MLNSAFVVPNVLALVPDGLLGEREIEVAACCTRLCIRVSSSKLPRNLLLSHTSNGVYGLVSSGEMTVTLNVLSSSFCDTLNPAQPKICQVMSQIRR